MRNTYEKMPGARQWSRRTAAGLLALILAATPMSAVAEVTSPPQTDTAVTAPEKDAPVADAPVADSGEELTYAEYQEKWTTAPAATQAVTLDIFN